MKTEIIVAFMAGIFGIINSLIQYGNQDFGNTVTILLMVIFIGTVIVLFSKNSKLEPTKPLINHSVFIDLAKWRSYTLNKLSVYKENGNCIDVKMVLFKDILLNVLYYYEELLKQFIKEIENIKDSKEIYIIISKLLNDFTEKIKTYFLLDNPRDNYVYSEMDKKVLTIAINKFLNWHLTEMTSTKKAIQSITTIDSEFYGDIKHKASIVLAYMGTLIADIFRQSKIVYRKLNGDLNNKKYKGKLIIDCSGNPNQCNLTNCPNRRK